jgi:exodeoxyribonuclease-3
VKLVTWNVNSIRARLDRLIDFMKTRAPDVLCLQETKVEDNGFPVLELRALGYDVAFHGQRTYNGVAILSRTPLADVTRGFGDGDDDSQARLIAATIDGVRVACVYVPNGEAVGSDKYDFKLRWMERLREWTATHIAGRRTRFAVRRLQRRARTHGRPRSDRMERPRPLQRAGARRARRVVDTASST